MFHVIHRAVPLGGSFCVQLTFDDGDTGVVDFKPVIAEGGVFAPMAAREFFAQVRIGERGRSIEWPGGIDFCADALWEESHSPDMTRT